MTLAETVRAAINDMAEHGFDSIDRVNHWLELIRRAAAAEMIPEPELEGLVRDTLKAVYERQIDGGAVLARHPGVSRFTLERVRPELRSELERRILASAQLIKLNRASAMERTLQRFSGWATSIPAGGTGAADKREASKEIRKSLMQLPFAERRVAIDQGAKFTASLSATLAHAAGAIAGEWHSHWRQPGYKYREDHKERDQLIYAVRGNWAMEQGLMNKGAGYTEEMTQPAEEPFCRCWYAWRYNLRDLPAAMLTAKGRKELERVRVA